MAAMNRGKSGLGIMIGFDKSGDGPKAPRSPEMREEPREKTEHGGIECPNCGCKLELKALADEYDNEPSEPEAEDYPA
jgi:hypothetical protein